MTIKVGDRIPSLTLKKMGEKGPENITTDEIRRPTSVLGVMSPKPTVVMVVMAQYMAVGMLVKPFCGPSITYIKVAISKATIRTNDVNTAILRRLASSA